MVRRCDMDAGQTGRKEPVVVSFFVPGQPRPGGSKTCFLHPHTKRLIVTDAGGKPTRDWKSTVKQEAVKYFEKPLQGAISVVVFFEVLRPKNHFSSNKKLGRHVRKGAPQHPTVRPDATKLWRAAEDALTKIAWLDDSQVVSQLVSKRYSERTGMDIYIEEVQ